MPVAASKTEVETLREALAMAKRALEQIEQLANIDADMRGPIARNALIEIERATK